MVLKHNKFLFYLGLGVLALGLIYGIQYFFNKERRNPVYGQSSNPAFELISSAFNKNSRIPDQYTCKGRNINPPLTLLNKPQDTKSLVLIMHDPDAVNGDFLHWLMWDIPATTASLATNSVPVGAIQGRNDAGQKSYTGPCPPKGTGVHNYIFELYALDAPLGLDPSTTRRELEKAMDGHILAQTKLVGIVEAD